MDNKEFIGKNCFDELSILFEKNNYKKILLITGKILSKNQVQKKNLKKYFKKKF